jgi:hypothetical protein
MGLGATIYLDRDAAEDLRLGIERALADLDDPELYELNK